MRHEAQHADPVVDCHHHRAPRGQSCAVIDRQAARAATKASAVDIDHDRQIARGALGLPHVERQAILAHRRRSKKLGGIWPPGCGHALLAHRPEGGGIAHPLPGQRRLRLTPAQFAHWRRGIGNAEERLGPAARLAANFATGRRNHGLRHGLRAEAKRKRPHKRQPEMLAASNFVDRAKAVRRQRGSAPANPARYHLALPSLRSRRETSSRSQVLV